MKSLVATIVARVGLLLWLVGSCADHAYATPIKITITDPTPTYSAQIASCKGGYHDCKSVASLSTESLSSYNEEFKKAFDVWNELQPTRERWRRVEGGQLPRGELKVSTFDAKALDALGGLQIQIDWTYTGADKSDFIWTQGLYLNYRPRGTTTVNPAYMIDTFSPNQPSYPFQFPDRSFKDFPLGPWPNSFFVAEAFLSKIDARNRTLTVFEGLTYKFALSVPEPATLPILLFAICCIVASRTDSLRDILKTKIIRRPAT